MNFSQLHRLLRGHRVYSCSFPAHGGRTGALRLPIPAADSQPKAGLRLRPGTVYNGHSQSHVAPAIAAPPLGVPHLSGGTHALQLLYNGVERLNFSE